MTVTTARSRAVAQESRQIDASQQRAIAARQGASKPRTALEAMAARLEVSPATLQDTLTNTVFAACRSREEFVALVIVANTYGLNPLLKEIYAFPTKGGGITPMVSVDGWIRLMNTHPQHDSIEFEDHVDENGGVYAIEATIYRKDRERPTKIIEYLSECKGNSAPWQKSPLRMLRHRALIQCARIAYGFSGLASDEGEAIDGGDLTPTTLPSQQSLAQELDDEIPNFDQQADRETGEVLERDSRGMTQVDEATARELDAGNDGTFSSENPMAREGRDDAQMGEQQVTEEEPIWLAQVRDIEAKVRNAATIKAIEAVERDWTGRVMNGVSDDGVVRDVEKAIAAKKRKLQQEAK
ncbi:RecT family recombinase [Novosphingobium gossypii]|uniref:RecT family recombinase n=1 Tax=Novosphingobium gossypii TaxID=1604774 RepID=UPI003D19FBDB